MHIIENIYIVFRLECTTISLAYCVLLCSQVPQQNNHCDCGTYLLHYVELFLGAAPLHFSLARSQGFPYFVSLFSFLCTETVFTATFIF